MISRTVFYFLLLSVILSCDTSNNLEPIGSKYFLKFYGQVGDQEGIDVKPTSDGGFIIGGNSLSSTGGTSDYLLIKVDSRGNQEWMQTYDFDTLGNEDRLTEVIELNNEFIIAGTSEISINNEVYSKMILLKTDLNGSENSKYIVEIDSTYDYKCTGMSVTQTGEFLLVGSVDAPVGISNIGNSLLSIVSNNLAYDSLHYSGINGTTLTHVKAFEVIDPGTQEIGYLAFGFKEENSGTQIGFFHYDELFGVVKSDEYRNFSNTGTVDVIPVENGDFKILGAASDSTTLLADVINTDGSDYILANSGQRINSTLAGISIAKALNGNYIISGNISEASPTNSVSTIFQADGFGNIEWQRVFGTTSPYLAGKVQVLQDGSIVFTGTAGLESQTKVFLVKLKSNGEMN